MLFMKSTSFAKVFRRFLSNKRITLPSSEKVIVLHSHHNNPYLNLAYENWMYENLNLDSHDVLYFWQNVPCVVIGRHQNPWLECDLQYLSENGISLARRLSGGGTVFHDLGNLNITFMTNSLNYNRKGNLKCIAEALSKQWNNLDICLSPRDDLVVKGIFKISGSAAKLGKYSSYHHCTLLCDANLEMLNKAIMPRDIVSHSRATASVSSHVKNLKDLEPSINVDDIITSIAQTYTNDHQTPHIHSMDIFEDDISEIHQMEKELSTWEWIFGKTSPFTITKSIPLSSGTDARIDLLIQSGHVKNVSIHPSTLFEDEINKYLGGIEFKSSTLSKAVGLCFDKCREFQDHKLKDDYREILMTISKII
ncbi:lipoyltransferase 1, mitochondrial-like [Dendronephthya gigantea]|uniref:lipoyltransferase 1, mitochondrial-like n=1 Tax=Dendronephthya gigantea TaxID=151771 RepID=UPI00106B8795|nr:lipoyltransferase 1, mitochondrial-like [Dendronephthya gigantea]